MKKLGLMILWIFLSMVLTQVADGKNVVFERSPLFADLQPGDKAAILMVHFGTTHEDTRIKTLDAINAKVREAYPNLEVREAYTSRIINKRLSDRGVEKLNPREALAQLREEGFTHLLIQSTTLTNGLEMTSLEHDVQDALGDFKVIRLATPLLFHEEDYQPFLNILTADLKPDAAHIWVGHGTYDVSTAQYAMLDHLLMLQGYNNVIIGCVEGYPYYDQALQRLKATGLKKVVLQPLMVVAGEHAKEDIAGDWKEELEKAGFEVEIRMLGLGELPSIQQFILDKLKFYSENRRVGIMEKKEVYEVTGEKMHAEE